MLLIANVVDEQPRALPGLRPRPALGVTTADFDADGWVDIYVANDGEDNFLWLNQKNGTFKETALQSGAAVTAEGKAEASMGVDADGDLDLVMTTLDGPAVLLRNDGANANRWLRVRVSGSTSNRSAIGAVVKVTSASGTQTQVVRSGSSYASQSELVLTFGLGSDAQVAKVEVTWPSGKTRTMAAVAANQVLSIVEP